MILSLTNNHDGLLPWDFTNSKISFSLTGRNNTQLFLQFLSDFPDDNDASGNKNINREINPLDNRVLITQMGTENKIMKIKRLSIGHIQLTHCH